MGLSAEEKNVDFVVWISHPWKNYPKRKIANFPLHLVTSPIKLR